MSATKGASAVALLSPTLNRDTNRARRPSEAHGMQRTRLRNLTSRARYPVAEGM